ncbi:AFG1-like ATPase [Candidatus Glomeribacter gigasporarum BEG34]|uniref:AFG1-like ATPase n=1 Tax=Candidatus Glomeribacter gigasporarum BEG34 TaxID=1070319 RepID=G2J8H5_9BURK|nr:cell division protein ZapE [Candidatus Glomeribacter gigasporarum]CCD29072.1 AFG1-like ATPase [Candidatus Glomeribacter gigasporarum BEG34]
MNVVDYCVRALSLHGYSPDQAQIAALNRLQRCADEWQRFETRRFNVLVKCLPAWFLQLTPKGVYLWGGVGRGKSFLMDGFYACVPVKSKTRVHFHAFMREAHRQLQTLKGIADPLHTLARRIAQRHRLICFDEFHVSDIADAMLLYRLFGSLFRQGVQFIMTSNDAPDALYPDGLHRSRFLPAIALFNEKLDVLNVDAGIDYRQRALDWMPAYYIPIDASTDAALHDAFETLATAPDNPPVLTIEAREIRARRCAGDVIWFDFDVLCGDGRSQNDYLEIANCFHVLILSNVPRLTPRLADAARRFTWLIDILYDHHVRFLMSAAAPMTELYREGPYAHEFARTVSRLTEMQSKAYREAAHR